MATLKFSLLFRSRNFHHTPSSSHLSSPLIIIIIIIIIVTINHYMIIIIIIIIITTWSSSSPLIIIIISILITTIFFPFFLGRFLLLRSAGALCAVIKTPFHMTSWPKVSELLAQEDSKSLYELCQSVILGRNHDRPRNSSQLDDISSIERWIEDQIAVDKLARRERRMIVQPLSPQVWCDDV